MTDDKIRRRKLYEEVEDRLIADIRDGKYSEGGPLPSERDLMARFGVGRPAIREALFSMSRKGIVQICSGDRARVTRPTPRVLIEHLSGAVVHLLADPAGERQLQDARAFFESGLTRAAARMASEPDLARLKAALDANHAAIGNLTEFETTDVQFHYALAEIPGNPIFCAIHEAVVQWLKKQRSVTLAQAGADRKAYAFHEKIYRAIAAGDPDQAEKAMIAHLQDVSGSYWRAQGSSPPFRRAAAPRRSPKDHQPQGGQE